MFELFAKGLDSWNVNKDGNGLGLNICWNIVEKLGGWITFITQEGVGTTF